ncbi:MAG: hypothetical protein ABIQ40_03280 [Bacteroidia bacterium]
MKNENNDWTEPTHLDQRDWLVLKDIKHLHEQGKMQEAITVARSTDTIVREEIPPQIWIDIGGSLTPTGLEKLRKSKEKDIGRSRS